MGYSEELARRVRLELATRTSFSERKMFGGIAFMVNGNMCCGVIREELMVRVGPAAYAEALNEPYARPMDLTGKPMKGMVYVAPAGVAHMAELGAWVERALAFVQRLPPK